MSSTATPTLPKVATLLEQPAQQEQSQPAPAQTPQAQISPSSEPPQKKKRPRAAQACDRCRAKKYKCDESFPCFYCRKHGYDCIYQGNTPRAWERTVNSSYVESLERRVQELEARTGGETQSYSPNPASALSPTASTAHLQQFQPDTLYAPLSTREEQQRGPGEQGPGLATKYGPIAGSPGYRASPSTSNVSKVRARESDVSRTRLPPASGERETSHGTPPETEIRDVNPYTKNLEYYGPNSTLSALGNLQNKTPSSSHEPLPSVVSLLHNSAFSPQIFGKGVDSSSELHVANKFYFRVAHTFIEGYFESLHYIHPIIDKNEFSIRAENLWFGRQEKKTFKGLYLTLMSLGALMKTWDEEKIEGLNRHEWCKKLLDEAQVYFHDTAMSFDLETVQGFFLMAKVCQNQLAPQLAYMYLGIAVRTALAAGYNRSNTSSQLSKADAEATYRTWWGLYSLEVEMSFSLGRPDSLGVDAYHNQRLPTVSHENPNEVSIIAHMLPLARIVRRVSVEIYHSQSSINRKLDIAWHIHQQLEAWNASLPLSIRPEGAQPTLREPKWARRQRLVLSIRYRNVQMALYRPFLAYFTRTNTQSIALRDAVERCVSAATSTINIVHEIFRQHTFFRTWWWNVVYISFPASVLLLYVSRNERSLAAGQKEEILGSVQRAIEVLEVLDECVVAKRAAQLIASSLNEVVGNGALSAEGNEQDVRGDLASRTGSTAVMTAPFDGANRQETREGIDPRISTPAGSGGAPAPQTLNMDDFNYGDLLLEEGWSTLFDGDLNTNVPAYF